MECPKGQGEKPDLHQSGSAYEGQDSSCRVPGYWVCPGEVQSGQNVSMWKGGVNRDPDASGGPQGCPRAEHPGLE